MENLYFAVLLRGHGENDFAYIRWEGAAHWDAMSPYGRLAYVNGKCLSYFAGNGDWRDNGAWRSELFGHGNWRYGCDDFIHIDSRAMNECFLRTAQELGASWLEEEEEMASNA